MNYIKIQLKTRSCRFVLKNFQAPRGLREGKNRPHKIIIDTHLEGDIQELDKYLEYLYDVRASMQKESLTDYLLEARNRFCNYIRMIEMSNHSKTEVDNFLIAFDNAYKEIENLQDKK